MDEDFFRQPVFRLFFLNTVCSRMHFMMLVLYCTREQYFWDTLYIKKAVGPSLSKKKYNSARVTEFGL